MVRMDNLMILYPVKRCVLYVSVFKKPRVLQGINTHLGSLLIHELDGRLLFIRNDAIKYRVLDSFLNLTDRS